MEERAQVTTQINWNSDQTNHRLSYKTHTYKIRRNIASLEIDVVSIVRLILLNGDYNNYEISSY